MTEEEILDETYDAIIGLAYPSMVEYGTPMMDTLIK